MAIYANSSPTDHNYRDNLTGQSLGIDVLLESRVADGYLERTIDHLLSRGVGGRPAGMYTLSYRLVPWPGGQGRPGPQPGRPGIVTIPVHAARAGDWTTMTHHALRRHRRAVARLDYRDFALWQLTLSAVSTGDPVSGYFDYLRFDRAKTGGELFADQQSMMQALARQVSRP